MSSDYFEDMLTVQMKDNISKIIDKYTDTSLDKKSTRVNLANDVYKLIVEDRPTGRNEEILKLVSERLQVGQLKYGKDIPKTDGRNWIKNALEEILDAMVYVGNVLLTINEDIANDDSYYEDK